MTYGNATLPDTTRRDAALAGRQGASPPAQAQRVAAPTPARSGSATDERGRGPRRRRGRSGRSAFQIDPLTAAGATPPRRGGGVCRTLYLVNPDPAVHQSVARLLPRNRYSLVLFASAESLLASVSEQDAGVLLLDMELEGMSGLELQAELRKRTITLKVIVLSGEGSVQRSVQAIKAGAVDFLETPCSHHQLLDSLELAFQLVDAEQEERLHREILEQRYRQLTPREREVMHHVVRGVPNRRLAAHLGVSERTVELHRARVMAKMEASSLPALVHIAYFCDTDRASGAVSLGPGSLDTKGGCRNESYLDAAALTDVGRKRVHNEDNLLVDRQLSLFVVCDGMGGHAAGDVASATRGAHAARGGQAQPGHSSRLSREEGCGPRPRNATSWVCSKQR